MQIRRAGIYARFSTDLQNDRSVDDQIALCRDFAARNGLTVVKDYFDKARSGASVFGRDGLLSLLDDARAGRFQTIIVEALDRLSRDQEDLAGIHKRLTFAGVEIIAVHDGRADAIQVGIRGLVSTLFLADLKNKIRRGQAGVIRDGRHAGGKAYGYKPTPGQPGVLRIDDEEAAVVRRIFEEIAAGKRPREVAYGLNEDGIAPPRGRAWGASAIYGSSSRGYGILRNPIYHGVLVWNRVTMVRDPETGKRVSRINPESEHKTAEAPHLAIVSRELAEKAIAIASRGPSKAADGKVQIKRPKRILSGMLRCSHCGGGMSIHDRYKNGIGIRVKCTRHIESRSCTNDKKYRLDKIEDAVISGLRQQLSNPALLVEYVKAFREEMREDAAKLERDRSKIERRVADLSGRLERLIQGMARGILPIEAIEAQYKPIEEERDRLKAKLAQQPAPAVIELHPQAVAHYRKSVQHLAQRLNDLDDRADAETIAAFRELVDRVIVHDRPGKMVEVEVVGHLSSLLGRPAEILGGRVVAGEGLEPPTRGL